MKIKAVEIEKDSARLDIELSFYVEEVGNVTDLIQIYALHDGSNIENIFREPSPDFYLYADQVSENLLSKDRLNFWKELRSEELKLSENNLRTGEERAALYKLPFKGGTRHYVYQDNNSHFDFSMPVGTQIYAARGGIAKVVTASKDGGCCDPSCDYLNNYIRITHSDGTYSWYLHLKYGSITVSTNQEVYQGDCLALSGNTGYSCGAHLHFNENIYSNNAKSGYQAISFVEGPVLDEQYTPYSQNNTTCGVDPNLSFSNGSSQISITEPSVNLNVCADNLAGKTVYVTMYRDAYGSDPAKLWRAQKSASSTCTSFTDIDGTGDTFPDITYFTVASLNPISDADAKAKRTSCYSSTSGRQLCDAVQRESNSGTAFTNGSSTLSITQATANLEVCASNLSGKTVYATLYRDPYSSYSARTWRYQKTASSNCVTFSDMDGAGDTFSGITYYSVASLNPISDSDATSKRNACYSTTSGKQLCDAEQRSYSGTLFASGYSSLDITQAAVNLRVCADNLSGKSVKATLYRDAYSVYPAKIWNYTLTASSSCVNFLDMDGAGDTFSGVTYYTVASLNTISDSDASSKRTACYYATGGAQLCDAGMRGTAPETCYSLTTFSSPTAGGGVEVSPASSEGCAAGRYTSGSTVSLSAIPSSGYTFQSWTGASGGSTTSITITGNKSVTANFTTAVYNTNWMTDSIFTGELDITAGQIREFLSSQNSCLANPISDVDGQTIDIPILISESSNHYDINPKVILATMQKEQSAISNCPSSYALSALMGAGSPSTARAQIDFGTSLFRAYLTELQNNGVTRSGWKVNYPKTTVDGVTVTPASRAIAGLFTYTPYAGVVWGGNMSSVGGTQLFKSAWDMYNFDQPFPAADCFSVTTSNNDGSGDILVSPVPNCENNQYQRDTQLTISANPFTGYTFDHWSGDSSSTNPEITVLINSDLNYVAYFNRDNLPPSFISTPITNATEDIQYTYIISASDPDPNETLTITATNKPSWLTLIDKGNGTAVLSGTPNNEDDGGHQVELIVTDLAGLDDFQTFTITVVNINDPPIAHNQSVTVDYETPTSITLTGSDIDDDELTYHPSIPLFGSISGSPPNVVYTPPARFTGEDSFTFKVNDGTVDSDIATVTITVLDDQPEDRQNIYLPLIIH